MRKVFLSCAALLFAGGVMAQNESKWRELARRDYEHCMTMADSLVRVWPQMSDEERRFQMCKFVGISAERLRQTQIGFRQALQWFGAWRTIDLCHGEK